MRLGFKSLMVGAVLAGMAGAAMPVVAEVKIGDMPAGVYEVDPTHASLTWKIKHMGLSYYTARFTKFDAELVLDPEDPTKSKLSVTVDPKSVRTDYPYPEKEDFDKKISEDAKFLNAGKYPAITFKSTKIEKLDENVATVTGDLTMLGVTKPVTMDVTFNGGMLEHPHFKKAALGFSGEGVVNRSDFGFTHGAPHLGDEVDFSIEIEMVQK